MKISPLLKNTARITAPVLLALLLAITILPGAAFATPTETDPNVPGTGGGTNEGAPQENIPNQPETTQEETPDSNIPNLPEEETTTPEEESNGGTGSGGSGTTTTPHPSAPFTPPADCIVAHAATPAQLCSVAGGLQYYFIGADGSSQTGPYIYSFSDLASLHSGVASLYSGANPFTGKSVQITYLPAEQKIRVSTFYPDTQYDTNKPYNFTVDSNNSVTHEAW